MNRSKEKDNKAININSKSKEKDSKNIGINSKSKEKDNNKVIILNKSKDKDTKLISKSKEKDNKIIPLNRSKGKDNKVIKTTNKSKGKDIPAENKKEPIIQKSITSTNKKSITKNIKEVKKGNKSPNPGNGVIRKKILVTNPKQKQGPIIKISPGKIPKDKINSAKGRLNTDNNTDSKKPMSKQGQKLVKNGSNRKGEKSPNPNLISNKK
jgi:hypothetical protein